MTTTVQLIDQLEDYHTRRKARMELAEKGPDIADELIRILSDPERKTNTRWAAITLLAECKCEDAIDPLMEILRDETNLRGDAWRALRQITGKDVEEDYELWLKEIHGEEILEVIEEDGLEEAGYSLVKQALAGTAQEISWNSEGSYVYLRIPLSGNRKQQLIVSFEDEGERHVMNVYTKCAPATAEAEAVIYQHNVTLKYGKYSVEDDEDGEKSVIMTNEVPMSLCTPEYIKEMIVNMAGEADSLEYQLTQEDHI